MSNTPKKGLDQLVQTYLDELVRSGEAGVPEMEVRFGTARGMRPLGRMDQDNVVKRLLSSGFQISDAKYMLRMQSEYIDPKSGVTKDSNVRVELKGLRDISDYCKTDQLPSRGVTLTQKSSVLGPDGTREVVDVPEFNFRASLSREKNISPASRFGSSVTANWGDSKKSFRYMKRHTMRSPDLPQVVVDVSVVRESRRRGRNTVREYKLSDSGVLTAAPRYEVEIEVENQEVGIGTEYRSSAEVMPILRRVMRLVMAGLQGTNYPVSLPEQKGVLESYMRLIHGNEWEPTGRIYPQKFIGPSPTTLQVANVTPPNEDTNIPNVRTNYTVTEKADGERKLLYIAGSGKLYLIDTNMNVQFTGAVTQTESLFNSLLDGEHILHSKNGQFINLYAAFDIYYDGGEDMREAPFIPASDDEDPRESRLPTLARTVRNLSLRGPTKDAISALTVKTKTFLSTQNQSIFQCCSTLLARQRDGLYEYETDGLIFTPSFLGVGASRLGEAPKNKRVTWAHAFKWKPPHFNTIDFLVTTVKGTDGREEIGNIFQNGVDTSAVSQIMQYKTAILRVGFEEGNRDHGYINPCKMLSDGDLPSPGDQDDDSGYKPVQFFPSHPPDDKAGICKLALTPGASGDKVMIAENGDVIEDDTIAEFSYNFDAEEGWRWKPLRVRYDKTADLRAGGRNFGNAYHVANSNWRSLHNPITEDMLSTGHGIPDELADDDIYYNRIGGSTLTRGLRDFHNLFVKRKLILGASKPGDTLIDLAVGKGGDWPKWIAAKLKFVFGIDVAPDNIENRLDGVCVRTLNYRKQFKRMPDALFVTGNTSANVRDGSALFTERGKEITNAVFGRGAKDAQQLGKGVYAQYGVGKPGFDVCSIQFAIHYMFRDMNTLNNFLRNVSETTKVGGYFIGTSYDGDKVFRMLENKEIGESVSVVENGERLWEVTKRYSDKRFIADNTSVNYAIDVFQESINKTFREYLVNYDYLDRLLESYGFRRLSRHEANDLGLPATSGSFRDLYGMLSELASRRGRQTEKDQFGQALDMTPGERTVSFLNRYFIYQKTHSVDAASVMNSILGQTIAEERTEEEETEEAIRSVKKVVEQQPKAKKSKKRLVLKQV